jgi:hypothetical protein
MSKVLANRNKKRDFEILFKDSPEYFAVLNAKMIFEGKKFVRFLIFEGDVLIAEEFYPIQNIHRIKTYL